MVSVSVTAGFAREENRGKGIGLGVWWRHNFVLTVVKWKRRKKKRKGCLRYYWRTPSYSRTLYKGAWYEGLHIYVGSLKGKKVLVSFKTLTCSKRKRRITYLRIKENFSNNSELPCIFSIRPQTRTDTHSDIACSIKKTYCRCPYVQVIWKLVTSLIVSWYCSDRVSSCNIYAVQQDTHSFFNEWVYSSRVFARHVSDLTGPSSGASYKLYLQIWYVVLLVLLDTSSRYEVVGRTTTTDDGPVRSETCRANTRDE